MEISSHYPYYAKMLPQAEDRPSGNSSSSPQTGAAEVEEAVAGDGRHLVRTQNLASPLQEPVDLSRAAELLRQVQDQLHLLNKDQAGELYQFDRLRDVLYRVSQSDGV